MRTEVAKLDMWDFDGGINDIIARLQKLQEQYPEYELGIDAYIEAVPYEDCERVVFQVFYFTDD